MSKIYCIFCGEENDSKDLKCKNKKCKRKLNPKSHLFRNYVIDKCKGDIDGSIFDHLISFVKNKLYGIILSASVVATVTVIVSNVIANNYIEELKEEPQFTYAKKEYAYLGEGLTEKEVVDKYLDFVKKGDLDGANGLIAENFLTKEQLGMVPLDRAKTKYYGKLKHDFLDSNHKFFGKLKDVEEVHMDDAIGRFDYLFSIEPGVVINDRLEIQSDYVELLYCLKDDCENESGVRLMQVLETIKIDGKVYILSEYAFLTDNYSRIVRYLFDKYNGDFSNLDDKGFYEVMDSCLDENGKITCDLPLPEFGEE